MSYHTDILNDGPGLYWQGEETTGTVLDNAEGTATYDGTVVGGVTLAQPPASNTGTYSFATNGTSGYVANASAKNLVNGSATATLEGWIYRDATNKFAVFGFSDAANARFFVLWYSDGKLYVVAENGATCVATVALSGTGWHHVVLVFNGGLSGNANRLKCYVDKVQQTLDFDVYTVPATLAANLGNFEVGRTGTSAYGASSYDEIALYTTALSSVQVAAHYDSAQNAPDTTPPTASGWSTNSSGTTITASLSESGCLPASGTGGFALAGTARTVSSWAISGTTLTLTLSGAVTGADSITVAYDRANTTDDIHDAAGNYLANFSATAVSNIVVTTYKPSAAWVWPARMVMRSAPYKIGVLADSPVGIQWVKFYLNGSLVSTVTTMTLDTDITGRSTWAYWYSLPSAGHSDSDTPIAVTAIVADNGNLVRRLSDAYGATARDKTLYFWPNFGGTKNRDAYVASTGNDGTGAVNDAAHPYLTTAAAVAAISSAFSTKNGGRLMLGTGTWDLTSTDCAPSFASGAVAPFEVRSTSGSKSGVTIKGNPSGANAINYLNVSHVTIDLSLGAPFWGHGSIPITASAMDFTLVGNGTAEGAAESVIFSHNVDMAMLADADISSTNGISWAKVQRNLRLTGNSGDVALDTVTLLDCTCDGQLQVGDQHADWWQVIGGTDNSIVWNCKTTNATQAQLTLGDSGAVSNSSLRNSDFDVGSGNSGLYIPSYYSVFANNNFNQNFRFNGSTTDGDGSTIFVGNVFVSFNALTSEANTATKFTFRHNHVVANQGSALGTDVTYNAAAGWDASHVPTAAGNLVNRITSADAAWVPFDIDHNARYSHGTAIGARGAALEPGAETGNATTYTLTGPATGSVGQPMTFTVTPDASDTWTFYPVQSPPLSGIMSDASVAWVGEGGAKTFTFTPSRAGSITISGLNFDGLTNPADVVISVRRHKRRLIMLSKRQARRIFRVRR